MAEPSTEHDFVARQSVDAAFMVHTTLGPGLLEAVYQQCLASELEAREIPFQQQVALPVRYGNVQSDAGYQTDLVVSGLVVVEIKATQKDTDSPRGPACDRSEAFRL